MKKMLYVILLLLAISFIVGIALSIVKPPMWRIGKTVGDTRFTYGPYSCNGKSLIIKQVFQENNLEGSSFLKDITVTYGENLIFKNIYSFKKPIEGKTGRIFKFDEYVNYLDSTQKGVLLPSQEELISRGFRPDEKGYVMLGSTSEASQEDLQDFAECFRQNKKMIYDQETAEDQKSPLFLYYNKAYLIKI
jgi:hypothetical protein